MEETSMRFIFRNKRWIVYAVLVLLFITAFSVTALANTGDVAGAIQNTWTAARGQIKSVTNNVIFPVIATVLAIMLFVKLATCYFEYRKSGQFEFVAPAIIFGSLIFVLSAPTFVWAIIGM